MAFNYEEHLHQIKVIEFLKKVKFISPEDVEKILIDIDVNNSFKGKKTPTKDEVKEFTKEQAKLVDFVNNAIKTWSGVDTEKKIVLDNDGYHIHTWDFSDVKPIKKIDFRFYISPNPKNSYEIINLMIQKGLKYNIPVYTKVRTDAIFKDAIIIYTNVENADPTLNIIKEIKKERPELFDGCEKMLGYGQIDSDIYFGESVRDKILRNEGNSYTSVRENAISAMVKERNKKLFFDSKISQISPDGKAVLARLNKTQFNFLSKRCINKLKSEKAAIEVLRVNEDYSPWNILKHLISCDDSYFKNAGVSEEELETIIFNETKRLGGFNIEQNDLKDKTKRMNITLELAKKLIFGTSSKIPPELDIISSTITNDLLTSTDPNVVAFKKKYNSSINSYGLGQLLAIQYLYKLKYIKHNSEASNLVERRFDGENCSPENFTFNLFEQKMVLKGIGLKIFENINHTKAPGYNYSILDRGAITHDLRYLPINVDTYDFIKDNYILDCKGFLQEKSHWKNK